MKGVKSNLVKLNKVRKRNKEAVQKVLYESIFGGI
jgi:hypothetical protein